MRARTRGRSTYVDVRARWPSCGDLRRVKLRARIDASTCDAMTGTLLGARGTRTDFSAARSACGDRVFDPDGEACDAGLGCGEGTSCTPGCACE